MARRARKTGGTRAKFEEAKHRRQGGRFADKPGAGNDAPKKGRSLVGEERLKTSGVTAKDRIVVLSTRSRRYREHATVESFVGSHPRGKAYALRALAADHKAGRIGFAAPVSKAAPALVRAKDVTPADRIPAVGTPERAYHDGILDAAGVFGPQTSVMLFYHSDGRPRAFNVQTGVPGEHIQRTLTIFSGEGKKRTVDHDLFVLSKRKKRPPGQAKEFLSRSVEAYRHIGIDEINLHANIDVGGYAWLRYGFVPDAQSRPALVAYALKKADALKSQGLLDAAAHGHVKQLLSDHDFDAVTAFGGSETLTYGRRKRTLGQHLFLGSDWHGTLDLRSNSAMARFSSYVSKRR